MRYMVVIEKGDASYGAFVPDVPGCIAAGESEAEVIELITEAIQFHLEDLKTIGLFIPQALSKGVFVDIPSFA
jgi:predicted RNase H-like HicB family nuclease